MALTVLLPSTATAQFGLFGIPKDPSVPVGGVDIVVESDTSTPRFYNGRPEPSVGSRLLLTAIPHTQGTSTTDSFVYRWDVNGVITEGFQQSVHHNSGINNQITIKLRVSDLEGTLFAETNKIVQLSDPQILFYEDNPLRGLSRTAITDTH
ncbi:MAG: hypothetical protein AAFO91_18250, partial [Bacteroidota bacterium]